MAKRIQRQRTKGWRMPEDAVYVGRPTKWGNPYRVGEQWDQSFVWELPSWSEAHTRDGITTLTRATAVEAFATNVLFSNTELSELRGKDLACWCPLGQPCHADVLLEWANAEVE